MMWSEYVRWTCEVNMWGEHVRWTCDENMWGDYAHWWGRTFGTNVSKSTLNRYRFPQQLCTIFWASYIIYRPALINCLSRLEGWPRTCTGSQPSWPHICADVSHPMPSQCAEAWLLSLYSRPSTRPDMEDAWPVRIEAGGQDGGGGMVRWWNMWGGGGGRADQVCQ